VALSLSVQTSIPSLEIKFGMGGLTLVLDLTEASWGYILYFLPYELHNLF